MSKRNVTQNMSVVWKYGHITTHLHFQKKSLRLKNKIKPELQEESFLFNRSLTFQVTQSKVSMLKYKGA